LIGELPGIVADLSTDRKLADKLEDTIGTLQDALGELTESPPDNKKALRKIEGAVKKLKKAIKKGLDPAKGTEFMDQLAEIPRQIAVEALNEAIAQGGRPKKINDAQKALAKGDALRATGKFKKAVAKYREALKEAERSLT
jgi:tetratricopeptide (TPR) repeat protein